MKIPTMKIAELLKNANIAITTREYQKMYFNNNFFVRTNKKDIINSTKDNIFPPAGTPIFLQKHNKRQHFSLTGMRFFSAKTQQKTTNSALTH